MGDKKMVGVRLPTDTHERIEEYAEERDISKSDALRRMIEQGIDLEETGLTVAASKSGSDHSPDDDDAEVMADGGSVIRPILNFISAFYAGISLLLFLLLTAVAFTSLELPFTDFTSLFGLMMSMMILVSLSSFLLYTEVPEKIDRVLYIRFQNIRLRITDVIA